MKEERVMEDDSDREEERDRDENRDREEEDRQDARNYLKSSWRTGRRRTGT